MFQNSEQVAVSRVKRISRTKDIPPEVKIDPWYAPPINKTLACRTWTPVLKLSMTSLNIQVSLAGVGFAVTAKSMETPPLAVLTGIPGYAVEPG
jgi:hypothetical protein